MLELLVEILREEGYATLAAENGAAALAIATARRPDIVLSDMMMPGLDGAALAAAFARWVPPVPVVLMSAAGRHQPVGDTPFVQKPFDLDQMLAVLAATIAA